MQGPTQAAKASVLQISKFEWPSERHSTSFWLHLAQVTPMSFCMVQSEQFRRLGNGAEGVGVGEGGIGVVGVGSGVGVGTGIGTGVGTGIGTGVGPRTFE